MVTSSSSASASDIHDVSLELATLKAELRSDIRSLSSSVEEMKDSLVRIGELRTDIARFAVHHDQFRVETQTMWKRIDDLRIDVESLKSQTDNWKGRLQMIGAVLTVLSAIAGGMVTWTWVTVQSVPVIAERLNSLEQRAKIIGEKLIEQSKRD